jgi:glyoxylase-like metal-dependent hydrolase (beta-lactamase superfamily II)
VPRPFTSTRTSSRSAKRTFSIARSRQRHLLLERDAELVGAAVPRMIDLGGRRVTITPRSGHTAKDLTVSVEDPAVVFGGDLVWNGMFPNYVDAIPSLLTREVRALGVNDKAVIVPGHGAIPSREQFGRFLELLDLIEGTAPRAHAAGRSPTEAAAEFKLPPAASSSDARIRGLIVTPY